MGLYKVALEAVEDSVTDLKSFLEGQESEAVSILLEKISDVMDLITKKQDIIQAVKNTLDDYISDMRALVAEETLGVVTRVDTVDIKFKLDQIESSREYLQAYVSSPVRNAFHLCLETDGDAIERKNKLIRNYNKLESFRNSQLVPLASRIKSKLGEMYAIYNNSLAFYETMDCNWKKQIDAVYNQFASRKNKLLNLNGKSSILIDTILESTLMASAMFVLFPACLILGTGILAITLATIIGCVVLTYIPEEYVPDCLRSVREKTIQIKDVIFNECVKVIEKGPQVLLDDLEQYLMDTVQTLEGIASVTQPVIAFIIAGVYTVINGKTDGKNTSVDDISGTEAGNDVNTGIESDIVSVDDAEKDNNIGETLVFPKPGDTITISRGTDLPDETAVVSSYNAWSIEYSVEGCNNVYTDKDACYRRLNYAIENYECNSSEKDLLMFNLEGYDEAVFAGAMVEGYADIGDIVQVTLDDNSSFNFLILDVKSTQHTSQELSPNNQCQWEGGHGYLLGDNKVQLSICEFITAGNCEEVSAKSTESGTFLEDRSVVKTQIVDHIQICDD